jgi:hypothetical protein
VDGPAAFPFEDVEAEGDDDETLSHAILALGWIEAAPGAAASVLGLRADSCRWPSGDPATAEFSFCGAPIARGRYCERHIRQAILPRSAMPLTDA